MYETNNTNKDRNKYADRVGLVYARVSGKQQETDGHGRESQEIRCISDLASIGVPHERTFADTYTGGGDFMRRPAMREMLAYIDDSPHRKFVVVFDDLKRFARDTEFHIKLRAEFRSRKVELRCLNFNFDDSPEGGFVEVIFAAQNELERKQNRRQVVQKMEARLKAGYWPFGSKKGYDMVRQEEHGKIAVPNSDGMILKEALIAFSQGELARKIDFCRFLVAKQFWKCQSPEKYIDQATAILSDCFYMGDIEYRRWEVARRPGKHAGIISAAVFQRNQLRMQKPGTATRLRKDVTPDFPIRGLILCECNRHLTAAWSKGRSRKYRYYSCQNRSCSSYARSLPASTVEGDFFSLLAKATLKPEADAVIQAIFDRAWEAHTSGATKRKAERQQDVQELEGRISRLAIVAADAPNEHVRRAYEKQIEETARELERVRALSEETADLSVPYRTALGKATQLLRNPYAAWQTLDLEEQRRLFFLVFDDKLVYGKKLGYRTAEIPRVAKLFEEFVVTNSGDVDIDRKTSNRIREYLERFWGYYQSSPALRAALDVAA